MLEEHKAVILQKYARAWLARRRFQNIRRFVLNIQLSYRVQHLQKKIEEQVRSTSQFEACTNFLLCLFYSELSRRLETYMNYSIHASLDKTEYVRDIVLYEKSLVFFPHPG